MRVLDLLLRAAGAALSALMAAGLALLEGAATPGFWVLPVLAAVTGNAFLIWFAQSTVDRPWSWMIPTTAWFLVMVAMVAPSTEGDQIATSWTGLATLAAGAATFFVAIAVRPVATFLET